MTPQWHLTPELLQNYRSGLNQGVLDDAVEAHVAACPECRARLTQDGDMNDLDPIWDSISTRVGTPRQGILTRTLVRVGVPEEDLVVVRASAGLYRPWTLAVLGAFVAAVAAAAVPRGMEHLAFFLLAPLVPVLAVAAAYDVADPFRELAASTSAGKLRVTLLRALAALIVALPVTVAVGLWIPGLSEITFVWLLPAVMLCSLLLLLLTWLRARAAAPVVVVIWAAVAIALTNPGVLTAPESPVVQALCAILAALFMAGLVLRTASTRFHGGYS